MPAIAAIDNETLDHLLSVVDDARNLTGIRALSKPRVTATAKGRAPSAGARPSKSVRGLRAQERPHPASAPVCRAAQCPGRGLATGDQALQASAAFSAVL